MTDPRWKQLASSLINRSLGIKPGDRLMIAMIEVESYPLALAAYEACVQAGGYAQVQFMSEAMKHALLRYGTDDQIAWVPEIEAHGMDWADHYLALRGAFNLGECYDIPDAKIAAYQKAMGKISTLRWQKTNWTLVRVPNERFAQQAGISYDRIMDMFFEACMLDWDACAARWRHIADLLDAGQHLRLVAGDTDLSFAYQGERWVVCDNGINVPDGEIFVSPHWESVEGHIAFDFPATLGGRIIRDLALTFEKGLVTDVQASTNLDFVRAVLAQDEGARRCGEFAFGTNPKIDIPTTDILWDEKIAGTVHLALGRPYNKAYASAIHWDIVKDTRRDAEVFVDGQLIFRDGAFFV